METAAGVLLLVAGGLAIGSGIWPMKLMRLFQFEHWWFVGMSMGLIVIPWTVTLSLFPDALQAFRDVPLSALLISNVFSIAWGIANVLCGLCFVRIGVALTMAILSGLGVSVASIMPLVFKGSGLFKNSPDLVSPAGATILCGIGVMLIGVTLAALAGFGRDRQLKRLSQTSGNFFVGLLMTVVAGVASAGLMLAFVYSQGPIVARVSVVPCGQTIAVDVAGDRAVSGEYAVDQEGYLALKGKPGAGPLKIGGLTAKAAGNRIAECLGIVQSDADPKVIVDARNILAILPIQAVGLLGGALINVLYPAYLMTRRKSWGVLLQSWRELCLGAVIGFQMCLAVALANKGMLLLGAIGASVGAGIQQSMQMVGGQSLGFISGEWRGVHGVPRRQMYWAIALLIVAAVIMTYSKTLG